MTGVEWSLVWVTVTVAAVAFMQGAGDEDGLE